MVQHKSVIYLPLSLNGQIIHSREEMITLWPKVEKAVQRAPLSPTLNNGSSLFSGREYCNFGIDISLLTEKKGHDYVIQNIAWLG